MSKHNPNQDFYKIGGRSQTDGPDRGEPVDTNLNQPQFDDRNAGKDAHPAVKRAKKK